MADTVRKSAAYVGPPIGEGPWNIAFLLSEAEWQRSRDVIREVPQGTVLLPGDFIAASGEKATGAGDIVGISLYGYDAKQGPIDIAVVSRDCEVTDAYLMYGELDPTTVNEALKALGIIVREGVLPNTRPAGFGTPGTMADEGVETGIPQA
jgi:hypothetical protein